MSDTKFESEQAMRLRLVRERDEARAVNGDLRRKLDSFEAELNARCDQRHHEIICIAVKELIRGNVAAQSSWTAADVSMQAHEVADAVYPPAEAKT